MAMIGKGFFARVNNWFRPSTISFLLLGLGLMLWAGCATPAIPRVCTYSGPELPEQQAALVYSGRVYSVDGSTRNAAGAPYYQNYGEMCCLSLRPGEHDFVVVVPPGSTIDNYRLQGGNKLWYSMKVKLEAGKKYKTSLRFIQSPGVLENMFVGKREAADAEFVMINTETGRRMGTGKQMKAPPE